MEDVTEISLQQLFDIMLKNKLLLFLCAVSGTLISLAITLFLLQNKYVSSVKLYVYAQSSEPQTVAQDLAAMNWAQRAVNTYIEMLNTRAFYKTINEDADLSYTEAETQSKIKFSVLGTTEVFQATVTTADPEESLIIANSIANVAPSFLSNIHNSAELKIVDPPVINFAPVSPNIKMNLAVGLLAGLALAAVFVFIRDLLDTKIKSADEITEKYGLHILAEATDFSEEDRKRWKHQQYDETEAILPQHMESYRTARTNLVFSVLKKGRKKIAVASALSREGKTTTSINLAVSLSQQLNVKVLLVDCDFRKPRVYRFFKTNNTPGLTDYLSGMSEITSVVRATAQENLSVIPSGTIPPNPAELLASEAFTEFVDTVGGFYDYIIFDSAPINLVSDALSIVRLVDGVVLTAVRGESLHPEFLKTIEALKNVEAKIAGVILHGVERNKGKYYKRNGYAEYGYGYGNGYKHKYAEGTETVSVALATAAPAKTAAVSSESV